MRRDRDVAGLLRGLSGAINAVADELMKRSEATLTRQRRDEQRIEAIEHAMATLQQQTLTLMSAIDQIVGRAS